MTLGEALDAVRQAGAHLDLDEAGPLLRGHVTDDVVSVLKANRDRVAAVLKLRSVHRLMGMSEADITFVEGALLAGRELEVRVVARPPVGAPA